MEFIHLFENTRDVEALSANLRQLFCKILSLYPCMRLPEFDVIATKSLQYLVWYQDPDAITETLYIHQGKCHMYLWRSPDQKWYLDDMYSDVNEIAEQILVRIPIFHSIHENPKEVKTLLENGLVDFKSEIFPKFSEKILDDLSDQVN